MDNLQMQSKNQINENIDVIARKFPHCVVESINEEGKLKRQIDFNMLKQELSDYLVSEEKERYCTTWPDKKSSILLANSNINATLRPCREKSKLFETTKNLYIEGDNLDVLKLLQEPYLHKIDVIYIDPPYNTGNNLIYKNDFFQNSDEYMNTSGQYDEQGNRMFKNAETNGRFHTDWLNMIYPRLKLAKNLLSESGIIVVTIDDYEIHNLLNIMNELYGEENHLATIVIKNNPSGRSTVTGASIAHEYALFYGANTDVKLGRLQRNDKQTARYKEEDSLGKFEWVNFRKHGGYKEDAPTMFYPIYIKKDCSSFRIPKLHWDNVKEEYDVLQQPESDEIISLPIDENGRERRWKWSLDRAQKEQNNMAVRLDRDKNPAIYIKSYMNEEGMLPLTVWDDKKYSSTEYGTNLLKNLLGNKVFDYPKSLFAVEDCLRIATTNKNAVYLDFFSGSATTAHAVMQLNAEDGGQRRFILVQVPEKTEDSELKTICEVGEERIKKAGESILKVDNESKIDVGFRVLKLDSSCMKDIYYSPNKTTQDLLTQFEDNIKEDRTPEDLLFQVMLDMGVMLSSEIKTLEINGKKVFNVNDGDLVCCFDKDLNDDVVTAIAKMQPLYAVFRDASMSTDSVSVNFDQIFETYSPTTTRKIIW